MDLTNVEQYVILKGWKYTVNGDEVEIEICPFPNCGKLNHFSLNKETEQSNCFRCGNGSKSLASLKKKLGDKIDGVFDAVRRVSPTTETVAIDPKQVEAAHLALLEDDNTLDYLVSTRGFTMKVIQQKKLGLTTYFFRKLGRNAPALAIPYFRNGKPIYIKYRTLPPDEKDFVSTKIEDLPLYNEDVLHEGYEEIWAVEGESDTLAMLSAGIPNVIGIPGAGTKKTEWVTQIDDAKLKRINICYDRDEAGQSNVKSMAEKIGVDKTYIVRLPEFETIDGNVGKDLNEFLRQGGLAQLLKLRDKAKLLEISGVYSIAEILEGQREKFERGEDCVPEFDTAWPDLTRITGRFERGDVIGVTGAGKTGKTTTLINWLDYYVRKKYSAFMYCLEMKQDKLVSKWMSYLLAKPQFISTIKDIDGVPTEVAVNNFTLDDYKKAQDIIARMEADFLFGYTNFKDADDIFETIYQTKRRYDIDVVGFDNLHILAREVEHRSSEIDNLSKRFKQFAMEQKFLEIVLMQPTKAGREGYITSFEDTRGSVAPTQDVDCGIALSRPAKPPITAKYLRDMGRISETEAFEPQIIAAVKYARNAPGGVCTLKFEGAISKVSQFEREV